MSRWSSVKAPGIDPLSSLVIVVPVMFVLGYALQRGLLNLTLSGGLLPPLLVTFGISVIIQNGLLQGFGAYTHRLQQGAIETASVQLAGRHLGRGLSAAGVCGGGRWRSAACSFCSIAPASAARFAPPPTTPTPPS